MGKIIMATSAVTMTSREIAELTGKDHKHVIRDIRAMLDELSNDGPDLGHVSEDKDARGYASMFHLDRELTDTLLTGYSVVLRRKVIARWRELEAGQMRVPQTMAQALRFAAGQAERLELQALQIEAARPAVEFVSKYVQTKGLKGFREVAKLLRANEARFREFLISQKIMYRLSGVLTAFQNHIDAGRFEVRTGVADANDHAFTTTKFTLKGVDWVAGEWAKHTLHGGEAA